MNSMISMTSKSSEELDDALDRIIKREYRNGFHYANDINGYVESSGKSYNFK